MALDDRGAGALDFRSPGFGFRLAGAGVQVMNRRKFLVGATATAVAGPVVAKPVMRYFDPVYGGSPTREALGADMFANFPNGAVIKGWMEEGVLKIKMLNWGETLKPGRWEITGAPARSSEDQQV